MEVLVRDIIKKAEEKPKEAGVVDFAVDSWLLAEFVFKINRTGFYMAVSYTHLLEQYN